MRPLNTLPHWATSRLKGPVGIYEKQSPRLVCTASRRVKILLLVVYLQQANSKDPDQTAQICRLVWIFAVRICSKVPFLSCRPIYPKIWTSPFYYLLRCQTQQLSSALSSAGYFKSHCCKQCGPRSDCSSRSSLIWVHTVCLYAKSSFEKFARRCSRRHKQTTFSDVGFLGILRVNVSKYFCLSGMQCSPWSDAT